MADTRPLRLFISYSHKDEAYRQDLETYLQPLKVHGVLEWWDDRKIGAGQEWEWSIHENLNRAEIILLLISPDFLASEYCRDKEVKRAMERHEAGEARVIPVILRTCPLWKREVFGKLQGVPKEGRPIARWEDRDEAFGNIIEAIDQAAESLRILAAERERVLAAERGWPNFHIFRDRLEGGGFGPEMVVLPAGDFLMGSPDSDGEASDNEKSQHLVRIGYRFAVGRSPVTFDEWDACVADGGVDHRPDDKGWGRGRRPVIYVSWQDARQYLAWLSRKTGRPYRLLSEAEWEYAARGGTRTRRWWGDEITPDKAHYFGTNGKTTKVGQYPENPFKLYDVLGNVWECVDDCYEGSYSNAPRDGSARQTSKTQTSDKSIARVLRGGSWSNYPRSVRSADRSRNATANRIGNIGFRVARTF